MLNMGIIDSSPTGKLIRNIMLSFSEFERDMIIQRTREGKAIKQVSSMIGISRATLGRAKAKQKSL